MDVEWMWNGVSYYLFDKGGSIVGETLEPGDYKEIKLR